MKHLLTALLLSTALTLPACSYFSDDDEALDTAKEQAAATMPNETAEALYREGVALVKKDEIIPAREKFDMIEQQFPYSRWAAKAQLMNSYTQYERLNYDAALVGLNRFIDLNPAHPDLPYAYYLKAMSFYEQIADVSRDQGTTEEARRALKDVLQRFPESTYAREAKLKLDLTEDHLAGKEMEIGRFYLRKNNLTGAINRFTGVLDEYETTMHTPEALYRLTEAYTMLGLKSEARDTAAVLGYNYPGSKWYARAYELLTGQDVAGVDGAADIDPIDDDSSWWEIWN